MKKISSVKSKMFEKLNVDSMKRIKGGYTADTWTVCSGGGGQIDGSASQDGCSND